MVQYAFVGLLSTVQCYCSAAIGDNILLSCPRLFPNKNPYDKFLLIFEEDFFLTDREKNNKIVASVPLLYTYQPPSILQ